MSTISSIERILFIILLFLPCIIILFLSIYGICKRRSLEWSMIQRHSRKQTCYFFIHSFAVLWYLSFISFNILRSYFDIHLPSQIASNFTVDYISWCILIISALNLQMTSTFRFDRYYTSNAKLNIVMWTLYTILITLYVVQRVDAANADIAEYAIYGLCGSIILLMVYLIYNLYYRSIQKLNVLLEYYVDDIVTDRQKQENFTDTLSAKQIELLVSGWIKENILMFIPMDIEALCAHYIFYKLAEKSSITNSTILTGLFSLSISDEVGGPLFYGQRVNRFTRDKLEGAVKKIFMYKLIGIAVFGSVVTYCLRFICIWHIDIKKQDIFIIDIVLYLCIWMEMLCCCFLMPSNKDIYSKCCCFCRYCINKRIMKDVDVKYNNRRLLRSLSVSKWSYDSDDLYRYRSFDSLRSTISPGSRLFSI